MYNLVVGANGWRVRGTEREQRNITEIKSHSGVVERERSPYRGRRERSRRARRLWPRRRREAGVQVEISHPQDYPELTNWKKVTFPSGTRVLKGARPGARVHGAHRASLSGSFGLKHDLRRDIGPTNSCKCYLAPPRSRYVRPRVYLCWYSRWYSDNAAYTARHYTRYLRGDALKHERHEQILHDDFDRSLSALLKRVKFYGTTVYLTTFNSLYDR